MQTVIKLTNEYASNLNCLFFNFDTKLASYYDMFDFIFKDCLSSDDLEIGKYEYFKIIDIVFIKIGDNPMFKSHKDIKTFIHSLRRDNELLPVYLIKESVTNKQVIEMIDECYCLDGYLPSPFNRDKVYRFLHRVLKRLIVEKELDAYIEDLENQLFKPVVVSTIELKKTEEPKKVINKIDKEREKDIRFSQTDKISSKEFMSSLDDSIIDKVENIEVELDSLTGVIYRLETSDAVTSMDIVQSNILPIIEEIHILVESMGYFAVAARAFGELNSFLTTLSAKEFENEEQKLMFIAMLLAIINDLEKWLDVIFIQQSTDDIHYLDASFSSNILEIEKVFLECNDYDDDDDDLEFF